MVPAQTALALEELGWSSFQDLAIALCEDLFDLPVTTFSPTKDRGIDGIIEPLRSSRAPHDNIIQVKHSSKFALASSSTFSSELGKISTLQTASPISTYILVTNHRMTAGTLLSLKGEILSRGPRHVLIISRENIVRRVRKSASLRGMVPRLYGIGDLSQILDERRLHQATALLSSQKVDLDKFVVTESYRRSFSALRKFRLLVLLGDPAVGKSTIARGLSMAASDEFGALPMILETIDQFSDHWNPNDNNRLYWVDDTFGVTQRDDRSISAFNRLIPMINTAMRHGSRFIFTSRSYIWNLAKPLLKLSSFPDYESTKVEIDVRRYTEFEKGQIVYNHVRLGDQSPEWRGKFKRLLPIVTRHPHFKPEVARRLGLTAFTRNLHEDESSIREFVTNPAAFLEETIRGLDDASQAALALVLMSGGALRSPISKADALGSVCDLFGVTSAEIGKRLVAMDGAFFGLTVEDDKKHWRFSHPTIGEATAAVAVASPELLEIYLTGVPTRRILSEATCAGRDVKGAVIQISDNYYSQLIQRMKSRGADDYANLTFLAYRSTPQFRREFFSSPVEADNSVFGSWSLLNHFSIELINLLRKDGLLSPSLQERFIKDAKRAIIFDADTDALSQGCQEIMGEAAFMEAIDTAWRTIEEEPWVVLEQWESGIEDETDPEDHFFGIESFFDELKQFFPDRDPDSAKDNLSTLIGERSEEIKAAREAKSHEEASEDDWRRDDDYRPTRSSPNPFAAAARDPLVSLFSDVDE